MHPITQDHVMAAGITTIFLIVTYIIYQRYISPLSAYPGPFPASLTNWWKFWQQYNHRMAWVLADLHKQHGPVVRVGPDELSFSTAEANATIYKSDWSKGHMYDCFDTLPKAKSVIGTKDHDEAMQTRRIFSEGFAWPYIRRMEHIIDERFAIFRKRLDRFTESGEAFDLKKYVEFLVADIMGKLSFGEAFGAQEAEDAEKLPPATEVLALVLLAGQLPWLTWITGKIMRAMPNPEAGGASPAHKRVNQIAWKNVMARRREDDGTGKQPDDMLSVMLETKQRRNGEKHTPQQLFCASTELILAGTDTTANVINILLSNLVRSPDTMKDVVEELDAQLPALESNQAAYRIGALDQQKLGALAGAIRESHRRDTISVFNMPREVPAGGAVISGFKVPGGTQVFVNNHVLHRNSAIWGSDADVYDPTRFQNERGQGKEGIVTPFLPGRRTCAGQNLAIALILKTVTTLLKAYEIHVLNLAEPVVVLPISSGQLKTPLYVRCRQRGTPFDSLAGRGKPRHFE